MTFGKYGHFERNEVGEMDERWIENVRPSPLFFASEITSAMVEKEVKEMFEKRVYCMDEKLNNLSIYARDAEKEAERLEDLIRKLEIDVSHWEPSDEWEYLLKRIDEISDKAFRVGMHTCRVSREADDLVQERCVWKRIPPIRFWKKES